MLLLPAGHLTKLRDYLTLVPAAVLSALIVQQAAAAPFQVDISPEERANGEYLSRTYSEVSDADGTPNQLPYKAETNEEVPGRYIIYHKAPPLLDVQRSALRGRSTRAARAEAASAIQTARQGMQSERRRLRSALGLAPDTAVADDRGAGNSGGLSVKTDLTMATNATVMENLKPEQVKALQRSGYRVEQDKLFHVSLVNSVPLIKANQVWQRLDSNNRTITGTGVKIGVIDTGIDWTHPDLGYCTDNQFFAGQCSKVAGGKNFITPLASPWDDGYHGTHVAATIAGKGELNGVAPDATLYALKVCYGSGSCPYYAILDAIDWAVDPNGDGNTGDHLDIISLSLGGAGNPDDSLSLAIDNATDAGVLAVIAAGNAGPGEQTIGSPGTARKALTVGASWPYDAQNGQKTWGAASPHRDDITGFSSRGPVLWGAGQEMHKPDVVAPGAYICAAGAASLGPEYRHICISGTSMATPHVSGIAALLLQARPGLTPLELKQLIRNSADPVVNSATGLPYTIDEQGYGRVNALRALDASTDLLSADLSAALTSQGVELTGTAQGGGFLSYVLQMRLKDAPSWALVTQGNTPVHNTLFATLNPDYMEGGKYEFLLTVYGTNSTSSAPAALKIQHAAIITPLDLHSSTNPEAARSYSAGEPIYVYGTADGAGLISYDLTLCTTDSLRKPTQNCSKTGIAMEGDTTRPKKEQMLATVDFSRIPSFTSAWYALKLSVQFPNTTEVNYSTFFVDADVMAGFPIPFSLRNGSFTYSLFDQPVLADIDGNQTKELLYAYNNSIRALDYHGADVFDVPIEELAQTPVSVGDVDGDGSPEIVANTSWWLRILKGDGTPAADPLPRLAHFSGGRPVTLIDLNLDGKLDLLEPRMFVQNLLGQIPSGWQPLPGSPSSQQTNWARAAAATQGTTQQATRVYSIGLAGNGTLYAFSGNGTTLWAVQVGSGEYSQFSSPTTVDLNHDGVSDVVFNEVVDPLNTYTIKIHGYLSNGSAAPGFPRSDPPCTRQDCGGWGCNWQNGILYCRDVPPPSVADIDKDGSPEIVAEGARQPQCDYSWCAIQTCVSIHHANGDPAKLICENEWTFDRSVQIANVDEDPELELLPSFTGLWGYCYGPNCMHTVFRLPAYNADGSMASGFPKTIFDIPISTHLPVGDLDNDGYNELVFNGWDGMLNAWRLNGCANESAEFGQHGGNALQRREYKPQGASLCGVGRPSAVSGVVRDQNGRAVAGAEVSITLACGTFTAVTDAFGGFNISTACSGGYSISVTTPTLEIVDQRGRLLGPQTLDLMLHVRQYRVSVGIENRIGLPVPNTPIRVYLNQNEMTYNSSTGRYTAELEYGSDYSIHAEGLDGVEFYYGAVSGQVLGEVEHLLVRDSWEAS